MTLPAAWWCTPWAAGLPCRPCILLGARANRYRKDGAISAHPPSNIPFLALGAWVLTVGWFGFNVMSAQTLDKISGLVAVNSLMAMVGGTLAALVAGQKRPRLCAQRPAGRAGGGVRRLGPDAPAGRAGGGRGGGRHFCGDVHADAKQMEDRRRAGRVAAARPVRHLGRHCGGHFWQQGAGRAGRRELGAQLIGTAMGVPGRCWADWWFMACSRPPWACACRQEEEFDGADLSIHKISATPDREVNW
jgi:Amt family ammonium transporter